MNSILRQEDLVTRRPFTGRSTSSINGILAASPVIIVGSVYDSCSAPYPGQLQDAMMGRRLMVVPKENTLVDHFMR
jgi:hypothetical protein